MLTLLGDKNKLLQCDYLKLGNPGSKELRLEKDSKCVKRRTHDEKPHILHLTAEHQCHSIRSTYGKHNLNETLQTDKKVTTFCIRNCKKPPQTGD